MAPTSDIASALLASAGPGDKAGNSAVRDTAGVAGVQFLKLAVALGTAGGAKPFHAGPICNYTGGMLPFARSKAEREAAGDPRLSLEERYGHHDGYVAAAQRAADKAQAAGFLLANDAKALVRAAQDSAVLR